MRYRIENLDRIGHYWSAHCQQFNSEYGEDIKEYRSYKTALRVAGRLSKVYRVSIVEYSEILRAWETAMGMHGEVGSRASANL